MTNRETHLSAVKDVMQDDGDLRQGAARQLEELLHLVRLNSPVEPIIVTAVSVVGLPRFARVIIEELGRDSIAFPFLGPCFGLHLLLFGLAARVRDVDDLEAHTLRLKDELRLHLPLLHLSLPGGELSAQN